MRLFSFLLIFCLTLTSCLEIASEAINRVNKSNTNEKLPVLPTSEKYYKKIDTKEALFQIELPYFMKPMDNLNPMASFQYGSLEFDVYSIIIIDSKTDVIPLITEQVNLNKPRDLLNKYYKNQINYILSNLSQASYEEYGLAEINGLPAKQIKIFGEIDNFEAFYIISIIEGKNEIYTLMNWCSKHQKDSFENSFEYISSTFKIKNNELP